jgi:polyketide cyclase/dehydrase/lipid transport protein
MFSVDADQAERRAARPGDDLIARPDVVMDRAFTVAAPPAAVWPWLVQLGKKRAGWYLPAAVERFLPPGRRAARGIRPAWQRLGPGDVIPDYGGRDETFQVAAVEPESALVYRSVRGRTNVTWSITLSPVPADGPSRTRVHLRLRLGPVRRKWLARTAGEFIDALTIAGMAAGLKERLADQASGGRPRGRPIAHDS